MNKTEYRNARRLVADNGYAAMKWMDAATRAVMERLRDEKRSNDSLAERADVVAYCKREGKHCTPLQTVDLGVLNRFYDRKYALR